MKKPIKIGIAEDHLLFRKSVCDFLNKTNECEIVFEQSSGADIITNLEKHEPDVLLLDLQMPNVDGFTALKEISKKRPAQKIIIYSSLFTKQDGLFAFGNKIKDYLPKHVSLEEVLETILKVSQIQN